MSGFAIWSELLPLEALRDPSLLSLLARYRLELRVACFEDKTDPDALACLLALARTRGVPVALWPMLADVDGRWPSAHNGAHFARYVRAVLRELEARGASVRRVFVDLEPPIAAMERMLGRAGVSERALASAGRDRRTQGERALRVLFDELGSTHIECGAAVVPTDVLGAVARRGVERLLGLPVDVAPWSPASVMLYTSMLEGYSRGWVDRGRARALLTRGAQRALRRFGARAEVSLGVVGTGALGDEPVYRAAEELRDDVELVRAAGVTRLALFDLRGVLARREPERWLDALTK